jgi:hypothetical protein
MIGQVEELGTFELAEANDAVGQNEFVCRRDIEIGGIEFGQDFHG